MQSNRPRLVGKGVALILFAALMQLAAAASAVECDRDQFTVHALDGEVIAFSGLGGNQSIKLDRDEEVLSKASKGCVAMVSTSRRLLLISALAGGWTSVRYQINENPAHIMHVGDMVALAISDKRAIAFDSTNKRVVTKDISVRESVLNSGVGSSVAAAATDRRLIGFSVGLTAFVEKSLRLSEEIEVFDSASDILTVITQHRVLNLRHGSGIWTEESRTIR